MDLILIACSKTKEKGGNQYYLEAQQIRNELSTNFLEELTRARDFLLTSKIDGLPKDDLFLPAYQRYTGRVYKYGRIRECFPRQQQFRLTIVSALYGILDGYDEIRKYNVCMKCRLGGQTLENWWRHQGLGLMLEKYIHLIAPVKVYDLLPISYRKALSPWPPASLLGSIEKVPVRPGNELSARDRGEFIRDLLCH